MSIPAFIYARFSSLEQGRGTSLVRQFENGKKYAEDKGWLYDPEREISDKGRSAFHGANRQEGGALHSFEAQVERGFYRNGAVFVVEHFDRISRQGWEEVHAFLKLCVSNGVSVATIDGDRFYPAGQRIDGGTIMELVYKSEGAREESKKKSDRGLFNWSKKLKAIEGGAKRVNVGLAPAWIDRDPTTNDMALNPHRAAVLREIFDLYAEGFGLPAIVRLLNGRKEPSWGFGEKAVNGSWNTAYLAKLLANRAVLGEYRPTSRTHTGTITTSKGVVFAGHYPQAIPADLFAKVAAVRGERKGTGGRGEQRVANLFAGSITCAACGAPMYFHSEQRAGRLTNHRSKLDGRKLTFVAKSDRSYLLCNDARRAHRCDNRARVRYEMLEPAVLDAVLSLVIDDKRFSVGDEVAALAAAVAERERIIEGKRENLEAIVDSLASSFVKALATKAGQIEAELEKDEAELLVLRSDLARKTGHGTPAEQLERVREVRASVNSEDELARYSARVRVKMALGRVIRSQVDREGVVTVMLANGLMAWRFNKGGELTDTVDLRNRLDLHRGIPGEHLTAAVLRRTAEAAASPADER